MWLHRYVAVTFLLVVIHQATCTPLAELVKTLTFTADHVQEAFDGLDVADPKDQVNIDDLNIHLYHSEVEFAKKKIIKMILSGKDGTFVVKADLDALMHTTAVSLAVYECVVIQSRTLRSECFADQLLTYGILVPDKDTVHEFFAFIADGKEEITKEEVMKKADLYLGFDDDDAQNLLDEIGGEDGKISEAEFTEYAMQEDISEDFRECRTIIDGAPKYKMECLVKELYEYTKMEVTERDISIVFNELDKNHDKFITEDEVKGIMDGIMLSLDKNKDDKISYGEFRIYVKRHAIELHIERVCSEVFKSQKDEMKCIKKALVDLVSQNHIPVWLEIPDLDLLFFFEELDDNENGLIKLKEDLVKEGWDELVALKMIGAMDIKDKNKRVDLEEFMCYTSEPHVVYGITECLAQPRTVKDRIACYSEELQKVIKDMLYDEEVDLFYEYYDSGTTRKFDKAALEKYNITEASVKAFFEELGMGDDQVTYYEFQWYVRQQRLSPLFISKEPTDMHLVLLDYIKNMITEYDLLQTFSNLDSDKTWELSEKDCKGLFSKIKKMDSPDKDKTINFREFWVYLNNPRDEPRKLQLEEKCTKVKETQKDEVDCYVVEINNIVDK